MAKKKIDYTPYILGVGALAAVGFIFKDEIKGFFKKDDTNNNATDEKDDVIVIPPANGGGGGGGGGGGVSKGFNPLGTPKDKLNINQYFKFGDKGQEVAKMQQILNRIAFTTKKAPQITEDGDYGIGTETRLKQLFTDIDQINLYKMYAALFAISAAKILGNATGKQPNWILGYKDNISKPEQYAASRKYYFDYNKPI